MASDSNPPPSPFSHALLFRPNRSQDSLESSWMAMLLPIEHCIWVLSRQLHGHLKMSDCPSLRACGSLLYSKVEKHPCTTPSSRLTWWNPCDELCSMFKNKRIHCIACNMDWEFREVHVCSCTCACVPGHCYHPVSGKLCVCGATSSCRLLSTDGIERGDLSPRSRGDDGNSPCRVC